MPGVCIFGGRGMGRLTHLKYNSLRSRAVLVRRCLLRTMHLARRVLTYRIPPADADPSRRGSAGRHAQTTGEE